MKTYESFALHLQALLCDAQAVRLVVEGYLPLSIEDIGNDAEGHALIALAHIGIQNGDVMFDPEMVFKIRGWGDDPRAAEPISYRNDYVGVDQQVYCYNDEGIATTVNICLKAELKDFAQRWFRNLKEQGFFSSVAVRERVD